MQRENFDNIKVNLSQLEQAEKNDLAKLNSGAGNAGGDRVKFVDKTVNGVPGIMSRTFQKPPGAEKLAIVQGARVFSFFTHTVDGKEKGNLLAANGENNIILLETGKLADLIVIAENPLLDIENLRKLQIVLKEGQLVAEHRA